MRIILSAVIAIAFSLLAPSFAMADGAGVFSANCAACHAGGGNVVNAERTLQQSDLKEFLKNYGSGHEAAIAAQITNGAGPMPGFQDVLTTAQISEVAAYVEAQSSNGWS